MEFVSAVACTQAVLPSQGPPDICVEIGDVPESVPDAIERGLALVGRDETIIRTRRVADFWIARGERIVVAPKPGRAMSDVASLLLGAPLGAALHQRGALALHAAAVCRDGRAALLVGHSGSGKSTMAARLAGRGFTVLDDNIAVLIERDGSFIVQPGIAELRLCDDGVYPSGCGDRAPFLRLHKTRAPINGYFQAEPAALSAVYVLAPGDLGAPAVRPLPRAAAFVALRGRIFCRYLESVEQEHRLLPAVARLVDSVRVSELTRPRLPSDPALAAGVVDQDFGGSHPEN